MGSLTAHLLEAGDHGRLRFHPGCPVCRRERLYGTLSSEPVVPRRVQAVIAGGVLAVSSSGPVVAVAQEPDSQSEGLVAPEHPVGDELDDPGFDPGGDTDLPFDTAPAPAAPVGSEDTGDGAPVDAEPDVDLDARLAPLADTGAPTVDEQPPTPPVEGMALPEGMAAPEGPPPTESVSPEGVLPGDSTSPGTPANPEHHARTPATPADEPSEAGDRRDRSPTSRGAGRALDRYASERSGAGAPEPSARVGGGTGAPTAPNPETPPASGSVAAGTVVAPVSVAAERAVSGERASASESLADARFYVVESGDSLWSIAKRMLGDDASAGRVAREVDRLWSLNRSRIATGDPNLLMVGTKLHLR
jgi:LysM domain